MSGGRGRMKIGLSMAGYGYNRSAWRHPSSTREALHDYRYFLERAQIAERGLLDMVFLADSVFVPMKDDPPGSVGREPYGVSFEPLTLLSAIAPATSNIGLVATVSTSFQEPFHIARLLHP